MPRAIRNAPPAEIESSPALSLKALPGDGGIKTRKVAILVANGIEGAPVTALMDALSIAGAVTHLLGSRLGTIQSATGEKFEVDATLENSPAVLFDALVLPPGPQAVSALAADGHALEFVKDQYRHCKTILSLGASSRLLEEAGIMPTLPSGTLDPGLLIETSGKNDVSPKAFIAAIAKHRHAARDRDPPLV
jgi:catalase